MKNIFWKSHLPFLKKTLHGSGGRDTWRLARYMQESYGLPHQLPAEIALLQRGADAGDAWSMCELARTYFRHGGDLFLPHALRLWKEAIRQDDPGAKRDVESLPIRERILAYRSVEGDAYTDVEMRCALLTEYHLTGLGRIPWESRDTASREAGVLALVRDASGVLGIPPVQASFEANLTFQGRLVDGLGSWDGRIILRKELLADPERLIEVIFHELGHIVTFEIRKGGELGASLRERFGITEERIRSWEKREQGLDAITSEEDPDTLAYGVYTVWAVFFLPH